MIDRYDNVLNLILIGALFLIDIFFYKIGVNLFLVVNCFLGAFVLLASRLFYIADSIKYNYLAKSYTVLFVMLSVGQVWVVSLIPLFVPWMADPINRVCRIADMLLGMLFIAGIVYYLVIFGVPVQIFQMNKIM